MPLPKEVLTISPVNPQHVGICRLLFFCELKMWGLVDFAILGCKDLRNERYQESKFKHFGIWGNPDISIPRFRVFGIWELLDLEIGGSPWKRIRVVVPVAPGPDPF